MTADTKLPTIHQALNAVMKSVGAVAKDGRNTQQGFNFRGIDAVVRAVSPALRKHGVIVIPIVESSEYSTVEVGSKKTSMGHVLVTVTYRWYAEDGSSIDTRVIGEAFDAGDKAVPKAMSVAFRTALLQALALPTDEPDPDVASYQRSSAGESPGVDPAVIGNFVTHAYDVTTIDDLRGLYAAAGASGLLDSECLDSTGEPTILRELLAGRAEELKAAEKGDADVST